MRNFQYRVCTEVIFGSDSVTQVASLVKKYGAGRVLVVYGGGSAKRSGLLGRIFAQLQDAQIVYDSIGGVQPNPRVELAREGVRKALAMQAELILAVGGGSVIDTAKAIAHGNANPDTDIWEFWKQRARLEKSTPVGVVLTIPAAGSETSDSAVLTNEAASEKRGLSTPFNRPAFAVMDPALAATLPLRQVRCGVVDIMMHTLDRYFTPAKDNETTDELAEALLRVVIRNGRLVSEDPANLQAMSEVMWCGSLSHNGLTGLGAPKEFSTHQLGHVLGEKYDAFHGETLSAVWGSWARYVCPADPERFARYARNVWGVCEADDAAAAEAGIVATEAYFREIKMPVGLGALGVGIQNEAGLDDLAVRCSYGKSRTIGCFKTLHYEDIRQIYVLSNY